MGGQLFDAAVVFDTNLVSMIREVVGILVFGVLLPLCACNEPEEENRRKLLEYNIFRERGDQLAMDSRKLREKILAQSQQGDTCQIKLRYLEEETTALFEYIEALKKQVILAVDGEYSPNWCDLNGLDDFKATTEFLIGDPARPHKGQWSARELHDKLQNYNASIEGLFGLGEMEIAQLINLDEFAWRENERESYTWERAEYWNREEGTELWVNALFYGQPLSNVLVRLTWIQHQVLQSEKNAKILLWAWCVRQ